MSQKRPSPQQRYQKVLEVLEKIKATGCTLEEACDGAGVSRTTYSRWRDKLQANENYLEKGEIPEKSRRPKRLARATSPTTRHYVVYEAGKPHHTSANGIARHLKENGILISTAKVIEILEEEGLYGEIHSANARGELVRKRGLLKLCEKRHSGTQKNEDV